MTFAGPNRMHLISKSRIQIMLRRPAQSAIRDRRASGSLLGAKSVLNLQDQHIQMLEYSSAGSLPPQDQLP